MKKLVYLAIVSMACLGLSVSVGQAQDKGKGGPPKPPPARKIPGINADDKHPNGCVDCHKNMPEMKMDARISTLMKGLSEKVSDKLLAKAQASAPAGAKLKGKHPKSTSALKDIPKKCLTCHKASSKKAPPFASLIHNIHLIGGDENHFMTFYQGECTECHKLDQKTGAWSIPSGPEPK